MAVKKMTFFSISGPVNRFDEILDKCVQQCHIELQDATNLYGHLHGARPFTDANPYENAFRIQNEVIEYIENMDGPKKLAGKEEEIALDDAMDYFAGVRHGLEQFDQRVAQLDRDINEASVIKSQLEPVRDTNVDLEALFHLEYLTFRFGRMTKEAYEKLDQYMKQLEVIYVKTHETQEYVWLMYFMPHQFRKKIDNVFASLYFERIWISEKAYGLPEGAYSYYKRRESLLREEKEQILEEKSVYIQRCLAKIAGIQKAVTHRYRIFELRKMALRTDEFFYVCGWMPQEDAKRLAKLTEQEMDIAFDVEENIQELGLEADPPVCLENRGIFKAFEWFVNMYSLPSYNEFDPTKFMAITYIMIFGIMFGDVGHGLTLALVGLGLYLWKKMPLGAIMIPLGVVSCVFGFLYGSVFGFEELIPALLIKPMENATTINVMLYSTIGLGAVLILSAMIANIINGVKQKDIGKIWFSQNGVAGLVMYGSIFAGVIAMLMGIQVFNWAYNTFLIVIPLIVMFLEEPLTAFVAKHKGEKFKVSEHAFEFFEVLLSFVTNTISFIRIGAFALNHAGMLSVVFVIAKMAAGAGSVVTIILGNALVMVLEGLIVGIQVLRLEFYEMFSRYYTGGGRKFIPIDLTK